MPTESIVPTNRIARKQPFRWDQLSQDLDGPSLQAIVVADSGDVEILMYKDKILRIAEEYANDGILILKTEHLDQPGRLMRNLIDLSRNRSELQ